RPRYRSMCFPFPTLVLSVGESSLAPRSLFVPVQAVEGGVSPVVQFLARETGIVRPVTVGSEHPAHPQFAARRVHRVDPLPNDLRWEEHSSELQYRVIIVC